MSNGRIADFYDDFVGNQQKVGVNERIYSLYKRMIGLGLSADSNVLELGCGIGTMTSLLGRKVKTGKIEAVDLSPASIEFARRRIKNTNAFFAAADVVNYQPSLKNIHFITLFDVIEHIPLERHPELFQNLSAITNEQTKILINIPNPEYIEYDLEHHPEALQIIDQPVPLPFLVENIEKNNLTLRFFETYSIWVENDYQFFMIEKKKAFKEEKLSSKRNIFQKVLKRVENTYVRLRYS